MKTVIVGYGSIGSRHTRILRDLGCEVAVVSRRQVEVPVRFSTLASALQEWQPGYVVIANPTTDHADTVKELIRHDYKGRLLIEKPLFSRQERLPDHQFSHAVVAYNLRCHPVMKALRKRVSSLTGVVTAHMYTGSYLPDWRPRRDYRESYSASREKGGGVLRDLSHELDSATFLFGPWQRLTACGGNSGVLDISSDDHYSIILKTQSSVLVTLHINYLDRIHTRQIQITAACDSIHADLFANTLTSPGKSEHFPTSRDDTYLHQHKAILEGRTESLCSLGEGMEIMNIIEAAERAASTRTWIER